MCTILIDHNMALIQINIVNEELFMRCTAKGFTSRISTSFGSSCSSIVPSYGNIQLGTQHALEMDTVAGLIFHLLKATTSGHFEVFYSNSN